MTRGTGALWGRRVASRWRSGAAPPAALCCHVRPEPARAAVGPRSHEPNFAGLGGWIPRGVRVRRGEDDYFFYPMIISN
jgi:hypothetical protein